VGAPRPHALALAAGLALPGCAEQGPTEEERVRAAVTGFGRAVAARDYRALCSEVLAEGLVKRVERAGRPCEKALQRGLGDVEDPRLVVGRVTVQGDRARAQVRSFARGEAPAREVVALVRGRDGSWRIASLAGTG